MKGLLEKQTPGEEVDVIPKIVPPRLVRRLLEILDEQNAILEKAFEMMESAESLLEAAARILVEIEARRGPFLLEEVATQHLQVSQLGVNSNGAMKSDQAPEPTSFASAHVNE